MNRSQGLQGHGRRSVPINADEIEAYDAAPAFSILQTALREHKPALAEFAGRILGDGSPIIAPTYSACELDNQKRMRSLVKELFGYTPDIKIANGNYRIQLRRVCGHTLRLLGIPFGRKSITNPIVPDFVMESKAPLVWVSFLRGLLDDEAYVSRRGIEIGLAVRQTKHYSHYRSLTGSRVLDQGSGLLTRLKIGHVTRKGRTYRVGNTHSICWFLRIPRRKFRRVRALNLILLPQKRRKLAAALQA